MIKYDNFYLISNVEEWNEIFPISERNFKKNQCYYGARIVYFQPEIIQFPCVVQKMNNGRDYIFVSRNDYQYMKSVEKMKREQYIKAMEEYENCRAITEALNR